VAGGKGVGWFGLFKLNLEYKELHRVSGRYVSGGNY